MIYRASAVWRFPWFAGGSIAAAACTTDVGYYLEHDCPYSEIGAVAADDAVQTGFSPAEVFAAASVSTTAETFVTEEIPESFPVGLDHIFSSDGDALVVDYGEPADPACPMGIAQWVPARYDLTGLIGVWNVLSYRDSFSLVATAADLSEISADYGWSPEDEWEPPGGLWEAIVDWGLEELAREQLGPADAPDCELTFSLGAMPGGVAAGSWATDVTDGWLSWDCGPHAASFLDWTGTVTAVE